ncbi:MAG TPA: glycosyltransferase [Capillimicrobium sp.]|nr:glycosyltransferase [Capillimicrobium sp.]
MPPEVTVCVPSHERPLRLRWLLNALEEQTLPAAAFEVVVVHDSGDDTERLIATHPLAVSGRLRHVRLERGTGTASRQRNVAWRVARTPLVAFTDDDCRPAPDWLERLVARARTAPGAFVQGRTLPDPYESDALAVTPNVRTLHVEPPTPYVPTCNVLYPRALLERVGGFLEAPDLASGEDTDLALRCLEDGATHVAAPDALVYHAVVAATLRGRVKAAGRWSDLAYIARRHPQMRRHLALGVFWRRSHAELLLALGGAALAPRHRAAAALALPYLAHLHRAGGGWRGVVRHGPGRAAVDLAEVVALARGSARHRTVML